MTRWLLSRVVPREATTQSLEVEAVAAAVSAVAHPPLDYPDHLWATHSCLVSFRLAYASKVQKWQLEIESLSTI